MKNVLVALWSYKSPIHYGSSPMAALKSFTDKVQATAIQLLAMKDIETTNPFQAIFMAPEYLFVGARNKQKRGAMISKTKDEVVSALVGVSKAYPKILIIAGSAFWAEKVEGEEEKEKKYRANVIAAAMKATNFGKKPDADILQKWTQPKTGKSIPGLDDLAGVTPVYRAYNTVHAFLNGESAFAPYNKECDFLEADGADPEDIAYVPGSAGGLREVGKFQFGVEICFDHQENNLKGKKADFHVIVSDWVETHPTQCIGGYLLHASSNYTQTGVWKSGDATKIEAVNKQVPSAESLTYWVVPIEARA